MELIGSSLDYIIGSCEPIDGSGVYTFQCQNTTTGLYFTTRTLTADQNLAINANTPPTVAHWYQKTHFII